MDIDRRPRTKGRQVVVELYLTSEEELNMLLLGSIVLWIVSWLVVSGLTAHSEIEPFPRQRAIELRENSQKQLQPAPIASQCPTSMHYM